MVLKGKTAGLFFPLALFSVGLFTMILGFMPAKAPYKLEDFDTIEGILTEDADNSGPRFRTFIIDKMPDTKLYLDDTYLVNGKGPQFADKMNAGAKVTVHIPSGEHLKWLDDHSTWLHVHGLVVDDFILLDINEVIADQPDRQKSKRISFLVVGGVLFLGGVIFGMAKLKKSPLA